jgi:hypothetical protein
LEQRATAETEYGLLEPQNGMTVDQCLNRPGQSLGMEMK